MFYYDYDMPCVKNIIYKMEWMSDCCLAPNEQFFSYVMLRTSYFHDMMR